MSRMLGAFYCEQYRILAGVPCKIADERTVRFGHLFILACSSNLFHEFESRMAPW